MSYTETHFRFFRDDDIEPDSTPAAPEDTNINWLKGSNIRIRFLIDTTGDEPSTKYRLDWRPKP